MKFDINVVKQNFWNYLLECDDFDIENVENIEFFVEDFKNPEIEQIGDDYYLIVIKTHYLCVKNNKAQFMIESSYCKDCALEIFNDHIPILEDFGEDLDEPIKISQREDFEHDEHEED